MACEQRDITLRDVYQARHRIAAIARRTPLLFSSFLSEASARDAGSFEDSACVYLKLENLQETGSFKLRGAANKLLSLSPEEKERGVITVSSGNHGRAVAYVAGQLDIPAVVCLSEAVPRNKVQAIAQLGAQVEVYGRSYDEATCHALALQQEKGLTMIHPFDDPWIIAGQGTIGLELLEELPALDTLVVPLSGGGLAAGIGLVLKAADPRMRVIGVSMTRAPVMYHSLKAGQPIEMEELDTLADALAGGIELDNRYTFRMVRALLDEVLLVSEKEIAAAMAFMLERHHLVVEGGGAVGIAALLAQKSQQWGENVVVVLSGGNVDTAVLLEIINATP